MSTSRLLFSTIDVTRQAFYRNAHAFAVVNLKPIVPGHVLVVATRRVRRITELEPMEVAALFQSVQFVGRVVERAYNADALTIALQDGPAAGQTVPHVHVHVLPRKALGDAFAGANDAIYPALEDSEAQLPTDLREASASPDAGTREKVRVRPPPIKMDAEEGRPPRTAEDMEAEAEWLRGVVQAMEAEGKGLGKS